MVPAAKDFFAAQYQVGGRLHNPEEQPPTAASFADFEVPGGVVRDVLRTIFSAETGRWMRRNDGKPRDIARGFRSQVAHDGSGRSQLYQGSTVVQMCKTLTFVLGASCSGPNPMADREAKRAFFVAMVSVTRHKKYQAEALTDKRAVLLFGILDLRYSKDATFAASGGQR